MPVHPYFDVPLGNQKKLKTETETPSSSDVPRLMIKFAKSLQSFFNII